MDVDPKTTKAVAIAFLFAFVAWNVTYSFESRTHRGRTKIYRMAIGNQVIRQSTGTVQHVLIWKTNGLNVWSEWRTNK